MSTNGNPGVRIPPPLIFTFGLLAGFAVDYWLLPLPLVSDARVIWLRMLACGFALASAWLLITALGGFRRRGTDPRPWREDSALVVEGIYRHTRNPMYLGMALACAAIGVFFNSAWPLLALLPTLVAIRYYVIAREEAYLLAHFGEAYADYCRQVGRWL